MSLISDALKKARQEAARQDALRQGVPYAMGAADAPVRRAPWLSLLAGLGAGCLLAGVVFAFAYIAGWGPFRKGGVETRIAQAPAVVAPQPSGAPPPASAPVAPLSVPDVAPQAAQPLAAVTPAPATAPKPEPPRRDPEPAPVQEPPARRPAPAPEPAAPAPAAPIPTSEAEPLVPAPAPVTPTPAPQPSSPAPVPSGGGGLEEGKTYPGEVPVPGGGTLRLNGIAYSQDHPIAVLGGRVIGPGESIQGFTVLEILSDRVKLQGHGATVFLSTK